MSTHEAALKAKEAHKHELLDRPNVVGVGVGYKVAGAATTTELSVMALVRRKVPRAGLTPEALVPKTVGGVATDVIEVGDLRPLQARTARWRPAPGGVSVGHYQVTAGTLGCVVLDRASGRRLMLSNNHVLANTNDARPGDAILQPGAADGGRGPADEIARLTRFCPIAFASEPGRCGVAATLAGAANALARALGSQHRLEVVRLDPAAVNRVDAAVAEPLRDEWLDDTIHEVGRVAGTAPAELGMAVRKSGRSTGLTRGTITVLDTTVSIGYGPGRTVRFEGQIVTGAMSSPGDSGSLLVEADGPRAVGLLFAGSDQATIHNPIADVLECLDVTL